MSDGRIEISRSDKIIVWCDAHNGIIEHQMLKPTYGEALHTALLAGVKAMAQYKASKWLSDDRNNTALPPEHLEWADTVWGPMAIAAGWKHWALIQPKLMVGKMNMGRVIKIYADRGVTVQVFDEPEAARAWLKSV